MPVSLVLPIEPVVLPVAKIGAFKVEEVAGKWIDIWVTFGVSVSGVFEEYTDAKTGRNVPTLDIHVEDGCHPLDPTTSLRKCQDCSVWYKLDTTCPNCGKATVPYDGYSRLAAFEGTGSFRKHTKDALYEFITTEEVPDPETWIVRKLLDGTVT